MAKFSRFNVRSNGPSTWIADHAILEVEEGMSIGVVQPYIGRVLDPHNGEVLFSEYYANWSRAYGGIYSWYMAQMGEDEE